MKLTGNYLRLSFFLIEGDILFVEGRFFRLSFLMEYFLLRAGIFFN